MMAGWKAFVTHYGRRRRRGDSGQQLSPVICAEARCSRQTRLHPRRKATTYVVALDNVINSGGVAAGGLPLTGTTTFGTGAPVANNVLYAAYKAPAVFTAYDQIGNVVAATDITANSTAIATIRTIAIKINLLTSSSDTQTNIGLPEHERTVKLKYRNLNYGTSRAAQARPHVGLRIAEDGEQVVLIGNGPYGRDRSGVGGDVGRSNHVPDLVGKQ